MPPKTRKSLVLELQQLASSGSTPVSTLASKALVVASKLEETEAVTWLRLELNGYVGVEVPPCRRLDCQFKAANAYGQEVPAILRGDKLAKLLTTVELRNTLGELEALLLGSHDSLKIPFSPEGQAELRRASGSSAECFRLIGVNQVSGILAAVRTRTLEWALDIEKRGLADNPAVLVDEDTRADSRTADSDAQFERRYRIWTLVAPLLVALVGSILSFTATVLGLMSTGQFGCQATREPPPSEP